MLKAFFGRQTIDRLKSHAKDEPRKSVIVDGYHRNQLSGLAILWRLHRVQPDRLNTMDERLRRTFELCQNRTLQLCWYTFYAYNLRNVQSSFRLLSARRNPMPARLDE